MVNFKSYSLDFKEKSFDIFVSGLKWFSLPITSEVYTQLDRDIDGENYKFSLEEKGDSVYAEWKGSSSLWQEKVYSITANEKGFYYGIKVKGSGKLAGINYFVGKLEYETAGYLLPVATHKNRNNCTYTMLDSNELGLGYFAPPPFVFPFFVEEEDGWFGLGVVSKAGEYNYDRFIYEKGFKLSLPLYNRTVVEGEWEAHGIWGGFGEDALDVIKAYSEYHYETGLCEKHFDYKESPRWWKGPIFCGHGEQQIMQNEAGLLNHRSFANQKDYTDMYNKLKERGLKPAFLIVDSLWQESLGNLVVDKLKWPDFRGFVDMLHADGVKVVLWIRSFHGHGIPFDECILKGWVPASSDPTNPRYIERTKGAIRTLLSGEEGCFDCDGFKIDYINCIPEGEKIQTYKENIYGVELIKAWISLVHSSAKAVKEDALINVSCVHPYFAKEADQIRIHDIWGLLRATCSCMQYRKDIVDAVYPGIPIDTDSGGRDTHRDFVRYMKLQPKIGAPCLYFISPNENKNIFMDESDYELVKQIWDDYNKELDG